MSKEYKTFLSRAAASEFIEGNNIHSQWRKTPLNTATKTNHSRLSAAAMVILSNVYQIGQIIPL